MFAYLFDVEGFLPRLKDFAIADDPSARAAKTAEQHVEEAVVFITSMMPGETFPPSRFKAAEAAMAKAWASMKTSLDANPSCGVHKPLEDSLDEFARVVRQDINAHIVKQMSDLLTGSSENRASAQVLGVWSKQCAAVFKDIGKAPAVVRDKHSAFAARADAASQIVRTVKEIAEVFNAGNDKFVSAGPKLFVQLDTEKEKVADLISPEAMSKLDEVCSKYQVSDVGNNERIGKLKAACAAATTLAAHILGTTEISEETKDETLAEAEDAFHQAMQYTQFSDTPQADRAALQEGKILIGLARLEQSHAGAKAIENANGSESDKWQAVQAGLRAFSSDPKKVEAMTLAWKTLVPAQSEELLKMMHVLADLDSQRSEARLPTDFEFRVSIATSVADDLGIM